MALLAVVRTNPTPDVEGFAICAEVAEGGTAVQAFKHHGVTHGQFWHWTEHNETLRAAWHRARLSQAHALADQALELADEPISYGDMAAVNRQRLRVDTRKWYTSKIAPKIFGDRIEHDHTHRVGVVLLPPVNQPAKVPKAHGTPSVTASTTNGALPAQTDSAAQGQPPSANQAQTDSQNARAETVDSALHARSMGTQKVSSTTHIVSSMVPEVAALVEARDSQSDASDA